MNNHLKAAKVFANLMDSQFRIGSIEFGLDPLLDIIPGVGDIIGAVLSFYIVWIAFQMHVPAQKITEMVWNIIVDFLIGLVPVLGTIGDIFYKANIKNIKILEDFNTTIIEGKILT